jgi:hypothetical protein
LFGVGVGERWKRNGLDQSELCVGFGCHWVVSLFRVQGSGVREQWTVWPQISDYFYFAPGRGNYMQNGGEIFDCRL